MMSLVPTRTPRATTTTRLGGAWRHHAERYERLSLEAMLDTLRRRGFDAAPSRANWNNLRMS